MLFDYLQTAAAPDAAVYLKPFLDVISFPGTNGVMTGAALSAVNKFLLYGFIEGADVVNAVASFVCDCKFESATVLGDEVILMQILEAVVNCMRCEAAAS